MKILIDFFPILLFFIAYKTHGIFVATGVAIAASAVQMAWVWFQQRRFETMHLVTFGLLVVFGGLTIFLHDKSFIMWKPTILNWLFAAAFLIGAFVGKKTLIERMMGHAISVPQAIWRQLNWLWIGFFSLLGVANLLVAQRFFQAETALRTLGGVETDGLDLTGCAELFQGPVLGLCEQAAAMEADWVNFKLFGMMGLTLAFVIVQAIYLARHIQDQPAATPAEQAE